MLSETMTMSVYLWI